MRYAVTTPGYVLLVLAHALCGLVGFGALAATGAYAEAVRRSRDPFSNTSLRRFFKPGHNLASAMILAVPLLGAGLLAAQHRKDLHLLYPWLGLGCWSIAATIALLVVWPAEQGIQRLLARGDERGVERGESDLAQLLALARRCALGAAVTTLLFVAAFVVMVAQP